jgi:hypothetical protein
MIKPKMMKTKYLFCLLAVLFSSQCQSPAKLKQKRHYYSLYKPNDVLSLSENKTLYLLSDSLFFYHRYFIIGICNGCVKATHGTYKRAGNQLLLHSNDSLKDKHRESFYFYSDSLSVSILNKRKVILEGDTLSVRRQKRFGDYKDYLINSDFFTSHKTSSKQNGLKKE